MNFFIYDFSTLASVLIFLFIVVVCLLAYLFIKPLRIIALGGLFFLSLILIFSLENILVGLISVLLTIFLIFKGGY